MNIGPRHLRDNLCEFTVWAPDRETVELRLVSPVEALLPMLRDERGYWRVSAEVPAGTRYLFRLDGGRERPDPASQFQPHGVHGPSEVVNHRSFAWNDGEWRGMSLAEMITYEVHVGTFTPDGTFDAVAARLDDLREMGINAVELMPVAQFPGDRNWGYDGVYPFAVQESYGGPSGLKRLVDECHSRQMAVILDVVYNHLGPEGNYIWDFGPYFTDRYKTPWGSAVNFDGPGSDEVRNYFFENALYWFEYYHLDALRLDAVHAIFDMSAHHFLQELAERVREASLRRRMMCHLITESDLNNTRLIRPPELGGYGIDGQWCDDFHHSLRTLLTEDRQGYYADFGTTGHFVKSLREGYVYTGQYSSHRRRRHGVASRDRNADQFIVFCQNHDQVGNRMRGERLSALVPFEGLKVAAAAVLLSPYPPLLFMGEEYGEESPFLYFVSHSDAALVEAVRKGRSEEFRSFEWEGECPDPQAVETFLKSKLQWDRRTQGVNKLLLDFYRRLITLRKSVSALTAGDNRRMEVSGFEERKAVVLRRWSRDGDCHALCILVFNRSDVVVPVSTPWDDWEKVLDSTAPAFGGPGSTLPTTLTNGDIPCKALSAAVYLRGRKA